MAVAMALTSFRPDAFSKELVRLRTDAHLSQRALARLADVSNTAISGLETGDAPSPHPSMLSKLARGLATSGSMVVDERRAEETYLALMRAAGYVPDGPPRDVHEDAQRRRLIEAKIGDRAGAEFIERAIEKVSGHPDADFETLSNVLDVLLGKPRPQS
jgi:transcriptional regulator with XRE-family HTH domain